MNLLSSLLSGFAAAANGTAEIYIRDTSTRATWYGDFEASTSNSSGADIALDAYGSAEVYVNQLVDVVVRDEDGNVAKSYTDGYSSPNVEVISPAFTGTDYVTAAVAVSEPTTLQAVLNLWATNNGAPDWKVLANGSAVTIQAALGALTGLLYNVKSSVYGALGDGTTSDQAAIQAAHDAAVAAGGGIVFFPKGTYRMTAAIVWSKLVSIVGIGMDLSILTMDAAAEKTLRFTAANTSDTPTLVYGMGFQTAQSNTTTTIELTTAGSFVEFNHCSFGKNTTAAGLAITVGHADVRLRCIECKFTWRSTTVGVYSCSVTGPEVLFERCRSEQKTAATFDGIVFTTRGTTAFRDCDFTYEGDSPTGTSWVIDMVNGADVLTVTGCSFTGGPGTVTGIDLIDGGHCLATDNVYVSGITDRYSIAAGDCLQEGSFLETVHERVESSSAAPALTIPDDTGSYHVEFTATGTTAPQIALPARGLFPGRVLRVVARNSGGGTWGTNITFSSTEGATVSGTVVTTAADGEYVFSEWVLTDVVTADAYSWLATSVKIGSAN